MYNDLAVVLEVGQNFGTLPVGHCLPIHITVDDHDEVTISGLMRLTSGKLHSIKFSLEELQQVVSNIEEILG